jgi:hypothetical protein
MHLSYIRYKLSVDHCIHSQVLNMYVTSHLLLFFFLFSLRLTAVRNLMFGRRVSIPCGVQTLGIALPRRKTVACEAVEAV